MHHGGAFTRFKAFTMLQYSVLLLALIFLQSYSFPPSNPRRSLSAVFASEFGRDDDEPRVQRSFGSGRNLTVSALSAKAPQQRRPHTNRRPRRYWANITNFQHELELFWLDRGLEHDGVLVPSESILYYYNRHDLRGAIASLGGRQSLAAMSPKIRLLPGRWADAIEQYPELLVADPDLSKRQTPWNPQPEDSKMRWEHSSNRREKGYWNITNLFKEL